MEISGRNDAGGQSGDHWGRLHTFLHTDPRDAGCDVAMDMLDVYAELVAAGEDANDRFPGLYAHFLACEACAEDMEGLLAAIVGGTPKGGVP